MLPYLYQKHTKKRLRLQQIEKDLEMISQERRDKVGADFNEFDDFLKNTQESLIEDIVNYIVKISTAALKEKLSSERAIGSLRNSIGTLIEILRYSVLKQASGGKFKYLVAVQGMSETVRKIWKNDDIVRRDTIDSYIACIDYIYTKITDRQEFSERVVNQVRTSLESLKKEFSSLKS